MIQKSPERIAIFPGSFDPFTAGHQSIVERGLKLFDRIIIAIGVNYAKHDADTIASRIAPIDELYADNAGVSVVTYNDLTVDAAKRLGADFILRGVRSVADYEYERNMAEINRRLSGIETVLLFSDPDLACVSSSIVRELESYGKDVSRFMPTKTT